MHSYSSRRSSGCAQPGSRSCTGERLPIDAHPGPARVAERTASAHRRIRRSLLSLPLPHHASRRPLTTRENALIGLAVGVITSVATEPLDVVKTRIIGQKRRVARASLPGAAAHAAGGGQGRIRPTIARAQRRRHETCKPSQRGEGETPPLVPPKALQAPQDFGGRGLVVARALATPASQSLGLHDLVSCVHERAASGSVRVVDANSMYRLGPSTSSAVIGPLGACVGRSAPGDRWLYAG
eukprot:scaffold68728_cov32-Tisochrysis_lutea.AAC.2